jgi:hypothetical protein
MTALSRGLTLAALTAVSAIAVVWSVALTVQNGLPNVRLKPHYANADVVARVFRFARRGGTLADWPDGAIAKIVDGNPTTVLSPASRSMLMSDLPAAPPDWWRP